MSDSVDVEGWDVDDEGGHLMDPLDVEGCDCGGQDEDEDGIGIGQFYLVLVAANPATN